MSKIKQLLTRIHKGEDGITGLETAIILIAFVIVASVFAFVVLSTGLFSAERGKETVFAGLEKARGNMEVRGALTIADNGATVGTIEDDDEIVFNVATAAGGFPILVDPAATTNSVVINYIDAQARVADATYTVVKIQGDADDLLENGELFELTINPPADCDPGTVGNQSCELDANEIFTLEVVPPSGGTLLIERHMPPEIDTVMDLH